MNVDAYFPLVALLIMSLFWFVALKVMFAITGMSKELPTNIGDAMAETGWGTAYVNGPRFTHCVKLLVYKTGFAIRTMPFFGGGKLWLPADNIRVLNQKDDDTLFQYRHVELTCNGHYVKLYGELADYFLKHNR